MAANIIILLIPAINAQKIAPEQINRDRPYYDYTHYFQRLSHSIIQTESPMQQQ